MSTTSSSQLQQHHSNEIIINSESDLNLTTTHNSDDSSRLGFHQQIHHHTSPLDIMTHQMNTTNPCPCTHHYHHIHHHHPTPPQSINNSSHYHHHQHLHNSNNNSNNINNRLSMTSSAGSVGCHHHHRRQSLHPDDTTSATAVADNRQISGETHVAVTVHQQSTPHHQYQVLDLPEDENCDCSNLRTAHHQQQQQLHEQQHTIGSGNESIILSSSEESQLQKCIHHKKNKTHLSNQKRHILASRNLKGKRKSSEDDQDYSSRIEVYSDGTDSGVKINDDGTSEEDQGPPLPPRPPPRSRNLQGNSNAPFSTRVKKYVVWCLISGSCSCLLGGMFLGVYFLLRSYTSTVGYFETVPTFVPATLLILTGLCIISLARRRNRYSFLIKLSGACGLASALICALVTVTTTVLHMSRLQALRECEYSTKARTCTCYSTTIEPQLESDGDVVTFVFDSTSDCGLVHGALYSCLRAIFGLSVAGVLVAVFSCMLVYQLLSHERKKMYWEQLELRCRSLYESQQAPPPLPPGPPTGPSIIGTQMPMNACRCCEQCHTHRQSMPPPGVYPWDGGNRFWTAGGQPPPGNFYSPNPGGDELNTTPGNRNINQNGQRNGGNGRSTGWSWPRMPWQRNTSNNSNSNNNNNNNNGGTAQQNARLFHQSPASPDSQYGFSNNPTGPGGHQQSDNGNVVQVANQQGSYSIIGGLPYGVWGPPPPYSDPNSPARRGRYQYIQSNQCQQIMDHQIQPTQQQQLQQQQHQQQQQIPNNMELCHQHSSSTDSHSMEPFCSQQNRNLIKRQTGFKTKDNYENTPSDSDGPARDRFSNTLPVRKMKKRIEIGPKSIGPNNNQQQPQRVNVQNVFQPIQQDMEEPEYHEPRLPNDDHQQNSPVNTSSSSSASSTSSSASATVQHQNCQSNKLKRLKNGVENTAFQNVENENGGIVRIMEPSTESEVYFADVSSCCNISVKNDNYYDDANKRRILLENGDITTKDENEDYLSQRFGKRENSIRSRLPFPQILTGNDSYDKNQMNLPIITPRQSLMPKELSRQSMCSVESGEKTDYTDLSPATPCTNFNQPIAMDANESTTTNPATNFVASYPFSSNEQSQEAHRRSTKNIHEMFLAPDAQYEVIKDSNQYESTPLTIAFEQEMNFINPTTINNNINNNNNNNRPTSATSHLLQQHNSSSPKSTINLNLTPIKRTNLGTNITSIIQNLSSSDSGLLYPENRLDSIQTTTTTTISDPTDNNNSNKLNVQQQQIVALSNSDNEWSDSSDRRL